MPAPTPTMDLPVWRRRARIAAYIDLVWSISTLLYTVYMLIIGAVATTLVVAYQDEITERLELENIPAESLDVFMWIMWIAIAELVIVATVELWAAILLLKSTKQEENDHKVALRRARICRNVCICFLILKISLCFFGVNFSGSIALKLLFRGILLYVVCNFMSALEKAIQAPSKLSPLQNVVVKS